MTVEKYAFVLISSCGMHRSVLIHSTMYIVMFTNLSWLRKCCGRVAPHVAAESCRCFGQAVARRASPRYVNRRFRRPSPSFVVIVAFIFRRPWSLVRRRGPSFVLVPCPACGVVSDFEFPPSQLWRSDSRNPLKSGPLGFEASLKYIVYEKVGPRTFGGFQKSIIKTTWSVHEKYEHLEPDNSQPKTIVRSTKNWTNNHIWGLS